MMEKDQYSKIAEACDRIRGVFPPNIHTAVVLGSGLSELLSSYDVIGRMPYADIPNFPETTVAGHSGNLLAIEIGNKTVYILQGRFHYYEGYSTEQACFPVRVLAELGVRNLILTNSAGGLNPEMNPGDIMLITDHLSFFCESPLRGPNLDRYGPRFPDQTSVYDKELSEMILDLAQKSSSRISAGIYAYMRGPQYETPAEIRVLSLLGASAVGMSTVPEAIVASHSGLKVVGLSLISNMASGMTGNPLSHDEVIHTAAQSARNLIDLIVASIQTESFN
ncbi:MAG: purine-nucleoside phosphorylase [Oscillospiraceae bacterium]|nr:purine-nucleoside phosphorylase [Oscillospiraceae bacterium]